MKRAHVEAFMGRLRDLNRKPATLSNRFRGLQQFFAWAEAEDEISPNPMAKMKPPIVPVAPVPVVPTDELRLLMKVCNGKSHVERRDAAVIMVFLDTGIRREELANLAVNDVDLKKRQITVTGKARKQRTLSFGNATVLYLDRYLRIRQRQAAATLPQLWLHHYGNKAFGYWGLGQMLDRRAAQAGVPQLNPHRFRHTFTHEWLLDGGNENDLMQHNGWESASMLRRYGASGAAQRAQAAAQRHSLGDRL